MGSIYLCIALYIVKIKIFQKGTIWTPRSEHHDSSSFADLVYSATKVWLHEKSELAPRETSIELYIFSIWGMWHMFHDTIL